MHETIARLRANIARVFLGDPKTIDRVIRCLLARGHLLLEDVPGVGKTVLASAVARSIHATFNRIQLTPDMLPGDVLGVSIFNRETGDFVFKPGPIFANVVLADEINRTTPRTQTALLEAMNEGTVSMDGTVHRLDPPFIVLATQNPYEFEGTYPLPENQLDRFLMRIGLGYPDEASERRVLEVRPAATVLDTLAPALDRDELIDLQDQTDAVRADTVLLDYIVALARATRTHEGVRVGLSPRGSLALAQAARATALCDGRDYMIPEDVIDNVEPVCAHRIILDDASAAHDGLAARAAVADIIQRVPSPA